MKNIKIILIPLLFTLCLASLNAEEIEPPLDYIEPDTPPSAPTNKAYIIQFFNNYKAAIETKNVDKYLSCFSKSFSKEIVDTSRGYTNRFYLTYPDIEKGVKTDNFSQYRGKTVTVNCIIKSMSFNYMESEVSLDLITQVIGPNSKTEKRTEKFKLYWNKEPV